MAGWLVADRWPIRNLALADGGRKIVSIYAGGQKKVVSTDLTTVRDALAKADIDLASGDLVEPGLDTPIPDGYFNVNVYTALPYRIVDGQKSILTRSAVRSPRLIAQQAGVTVYEQDGVSLEPVDNMAEAGTVGQDIVIERATVATVAVDGQDLELRSRGTTVGDLLKDNGIDISNSDTVSPSIDTKLTSGLKVLVARVRVNVETTDEVVARTVRQVSDDSQMRGYKKVKTEGSDGLRRVSYIVTYNNGRVAGKKEVKSEVITEPVTRVEIVGTKMQFASDAIQLGYEMAAARGWTGDNWDALYKLWMKESGWNPNSVNRSSGACGIPQAYPCSKITDKSAAGQITWGLNYIKGRYGTPSAAWAFFLRNNSY
jgi:resuscitation-promoting factor RpfB